MHDPTVRIESVVSGELPALSTSLYRDRQRRQTVAKGLSKVGRGSVTEGVTITGRDAPPQRPVVTERRTSRQPPARRTLADVVESQHPTPPTHRRLVESTAQPTGATLAGRVLAGLGKRKQR